MKKNILIYFGLALLLGILIADKNFIEANSDNISLFCERAELIVHMFILYFVFSVYKRMDKENRKIFLWFLITNIFLFLNDLSFYLAIYLPGITKDASILNFVFTILPFFAWLVAIIIFLIFVITHYIIPANKLAKIMFILLCLDIVIEVFLIIYIHYAFSLLYWQNMTIVISFMTELIVINLCGIGLIYGKKSALFATLTGFIVLIFGDFLVTSAFVSKTNTFAGYGDIFWLLGLSFILVNSILIHNWQNYLIKSWFKVKRGNRYDWND